MRSIVLGLVWILTVVAAYVIGSSQAPPPADAGAASPVAERGVTPRVVPGASLAAAPRPAEGPPDAPRPERRAPAASTSTEDLEPFTLEGVSSPEEAFARLLARADALLARGEAGHLALLAFLDEHIVQNKSLESLFGSEEQALAFFYPAIKFLVERDTQVVDLTETLFETMAERPEALAALDDDTIEVFTEGVAVLLPGAVDAERLARFRAYASTILETEESEQPPAVAKNRRRIERALAFWAPRLGPDEAVARLQEGGASPREVLQLLRTVPAEQRAGLDLGVLLAPAVRTGDYRTLHALADLGLESRDIVLLDAAALEALVGGQFSDWTLQAYLQGTGRGTWPAGQGLVEAALAQGDPARTTAALGLRRLQASKEYVLWVLGSYDLPDGTRTALKKAYGIP